MFVSAREVEAVTASLSQELGRYPAEAEIAEEVGIEIAEYHDFLDQYSGAQVISLESRLERDDQASIEFGAMLTDPSAFDPQFHVSVGRLRAQLVTAIARLVERERLVAAFYFYEGLNLKEIGKAPIEAQERR
jgi:RNA polymerase sigma factor FliA